MRVSPTIRTGLLACLLIALAAAPAAAARPEPPADPFLARAFEVHYRSLTDAADLAQEVLSEEGSLTLKPRLKTIIVEDYASVLARVEELLRSFDLPPRSVEVAMSLFMGRREDPAGDGSGGGRVELTREVRGVIERMKNFTQWTSYEPLGSRSVAGVEGDPVVASLADDYRVVFTVESVHDSQNVVKFERFSLQRVRRDEEGQENVEELYTAGMVVTTGKLSLLVAASAPDSKQALFLALQVEPR